MNSRAIFYTIFPLVIFGLGYSPFVEGQVVEPISVSTDKLFYLEGDTILVTGNVSENLSGYNISIEVFAPNGDKVAMDQVFPKTDKTFGTQFTAGGNLMEFPGEYTIKVLYATESRTASTTFKYIDTGDLGQVKIAPFVDPRKDPQSYVDRYMNDSIYQKWFDENYPQYDSIYQAVGLEEPKSVNKKNEISQLQKRLSDIRQEFLETSDIERKKILVNSLNEIVQKIQYLSYPSQISKVAPFVDPNQDPQYYVDRYSNEPSYKKWFDENFPEYDSIYEAVGLEKSKTGINKIPIIGDSNCISKTTQALDLLKNKALRHYEIALDNISSIECVKQGSGIYPHDSSVLLGEATLNAGIVWLSGALAHESCHSLLYSDYLKNNPNSNIVPRDIYSGERAETFCLGFQYMALSMTGNGIYSADYLIKKVDSRWWEVPYEDRWW